MIREQQGSHPWDDPPVLFREGKERRNSGDLSMIFSFSRIISRQVSPALFPLEEVNDLSLQACMHRKLFLSADSPFCEKVLTLYFYFLKAAEKRVLWNGGK